MSHSQFHSTNLFILRHAWLNLWDKHMTTGRINQVTTFLDLLKALHWILGLAERPSFLSGSSSLWSEHISILVERPFTWGYWVSWPQIETALFPDLTLFRTIASCFHNKDYGLPRELPATSESNSCCSPSHGGFSTVLIAPSLAISKQSTSPLCSLQAQNVCTRFFIVLFDQQGQAPVRGSKVRPKSAWPVFYRNASLIRHRTSQSIPFNKSKGILNCEQCSVRNVSTFTTLFKFKQIYTSY